MVLIGGKKEKEDRVSGGVHVQGHFPFNICCFGGFIVKLHYDGYFHKRVSALHFELFGARVCTH